jgi:hypothetical protein
LGPALTFRFESAGNFLMCFAAQAKVLGNSSIRRSFMEKKKIAESIIIRVGGGIQSISRESIVTQDAVETPLIEADFDQTEDVNSLGSEMESAIKNGSDKIIN